LKRSLLHLLPLALAVAACAPVLVACGGNDGDNTERVLERLVARGQGQEAQVRAFVGEMPVGLPWEIPIYPASEVLASFVLERPELSAYFVMLDSDSTAAEVLEFYEAALDEDPWQVESFVSAQEVMGLDFSKIDDANVGGGLTVDSLPEGGSSIAISVQTIREDSALEEEPFKPGASRPLPSQFPSEVPLYPGSTVIEASWLRSPGHVEFLVTLLTKDIQEDVIDFYREELTDQGFVVTDGEGTGLALVLSFTDAAAGDLEGSVTTDIFEEDPAYTRVDIQLLVGSGRAPEN
jgi:hypothetical protein